MTRYELNESSKNLIRGLLKSTTLPIPLNMISADMAIAKTAKEIANDKFSNKMVNDTKKYQKKYGFDSKEGDREFSTHNNEADAFKKEKQFLKAKL